MNIKESYFNFSAYFRSYRVHVRQLILWGHNDAQLKLQSDDEDEPSITGYITEAINERLKDFDCPTWCNHYFVKDDPPVARKGRSGRGRPRADIIIQSNFPGRPEYVFEAKRLRRNGYGTNKYINHGGMDCFVTGLYADQYDEAAMLGYIQSDTVTHWRNKIMNSIDTNQVELKLNKEQREVRIHCDILEEWVSSHDRPDIGRGIDIYHILLDCHPREDV